MATRLQHRLLLLIVVFLGGCEDYASRMEDSAVHVSDPSKEAAQEEQVDTSLPPIGALKGTLVINGQATHTNKDTVELAFTVVDAGVSDVYVTNTPGCEAGGAWEANVGTKIWNLAETNKQVSVYARFRSANAVSECISASILHDSLAPAGTSLTINLGATKTAKTAVDLTLAAPDATEMYITNAPDCGQGGHWEPFATPKAWTLGQTNGLIKVYAKVKDAAGNESACVDAAISHSNVGPLATALIINDGASHTAASNVTLGLQATNATGMYLTNTPGCLNGGIWESYTTSKTWMLGQANGVVPIYGKFRDDFGNESPCTSASIVHDNQGPFAASFSIADDDSHTRDANVLLTLAVDDASAVYITNSPGCIMGGVWEAFSTSKAWTLAQSNTTATVYAKFRDALGNESTCITDSITHDDQAPHSPSLGIAQGASYTSSAQVALALTVNEGHEVYVTNDPACSTGGSWEPYAATKSWSLGQTNGVATVFAKFRDAAGNESACAFDTITHDDGAPGSPSISIEGGAAYSRLAAVSLALSATDASAMYITDSSGCSAGGSWEPYAPTKAWTLGAANAANAVYVKFKDDAGNEGTCVTDTITHDDLAPSATSVTINGGAAYATSTSVTLTLAASGASSMYITNTSGCAADGSWNDFAATKAWSLAHSNSDTSVYVKFKDLAGNESSCVDSLITHDNVAPANGSISINAGATLTNSTAVSLTLGASDASSMYVTDVAGCGSGGVWEAYATSKAWTLPTANAINRIYVRYRDAAGNSSPCIDDALLHDNIAPAGVLIAAASSANYTSTASVPLTLAAVDATEVYVTNIAGCGSGGVWEAYTTSKAAWTLSHASNPATVFAVFRDAAGNTSACASDTITYDPGDSTGTAEDGTGLSLSPIGAAGLLIDTQVEWQAPSMGMVPEDPFTPLWHFNGSVYFVWVAADLRPWVTKITNQVPVSAPLDDGLDYKVQDDGHHRYSLGVDKDGYLHVTGDMHNYTNETTSVITAYPARYQKQTILYWKSKAPESVAAGFEFVGGKDATTAIPGSGWITGRFFTDNYGELYYSSQIHAINWLHEPGYMGLGLYKFDSAASRWTALGGLADNIRSGIYYTTFFWEEAGLFDWFQNYQGSFAFDRMNRMHFAIVANTDTAASGLDRVVYAVSGDGGTTWEKADGTPIEALPIRAKDNLANQGDLITEATGAPYFGARVSVIADRHGMPGVSVDGDWWTWDGASWNKTNAQNFVGFPRSQYGYRLADDGLFMTLPGEAKLMRANSFLEPTYGYDLLGYDNYLGFDETTIRTSGAIYGIGVDRTNHTQTVLKTTYRYAPLPCAWEHRDIATSAVPYNGTAGYHDGRFEILSYGADLNNQNDSFGYAYRPLNGDGTIIARVQTTVPDPAGHSRAGVMMRETLAANSRHVSLLIAPGTDPSQGAILSYRNTADGWAVNSSMNGIGSPYWVRLVRSGDLFVGSVSADGDTWVEHSRVTVPMATSLYVGFAAASYTHLHFMQKAVFDSISFSATNDDGVCD